MVRVGPSLLGHDKRNQHAGPYNVKKMPVTGAVIDRPMSFVIVTIAKRLIDHKTQKHHATQHVQCVNKRKCEGHAIDLHRAIGLTEVLNQQILQPKPWMTTKATAAIQANISNLRKSLCRSRCTIQQARCRKMPTRISTAVLAQKVTGTLKGS